MLKRAKIKALKGKVLMVIKAITFCHISLSDIQCKVCTVKLNEKLNP